MAAEANVSVIAELTGLGIIQNFVKKGSDETTPTAATYNYRTITTADTEEALDLGDVSTVTLVILYAVDYDVDIDCDFVSSFDADLTAKAGGIPAVIPYPAGAVYVKGESGQTPAYEYLVVGTT